MLRLRFPLLVGLLTLAACSKSNRLVPEPEAAASAAATPPLHPAVVWHLTVASGKAHVDMDAAKLHLEGDTTAAQGSFQVTPTDLAATHGGLMVDLTTLAMRTAGSADDPGQTKAAGAWLETSPASTGSQGYRYASFAIQSVDGLSAADLTKVEPARDGGDDVRTVTLTAHGDLLIHGHKLQRDAKVRVAFRHPSGVPADSRPTRVDMTSTEPVAVPLQEIDARPRDLTGKVVALAANLTGKVADHADVTVSVLATPVP